MRNSPGTDRIEKSLIKPLQKLDQYEILNGSCGCVFIMAGNSFRSDDGVGPYIAEKLSAAVSSMPTLHLINAQTNPENYIDEVADLAPKFVVFLDAAQFGGSPGEFIFIDDEASLPESSASTHTLPLNLIAALIRAQCSCSVMYIGIQAGNLHLGEQLTLEVKRAADLLVHEISSRIERHKNA